MAPPLRIAVVTRMLMKNKLEGIGRFAHETLQRIVKAHPEHQFIFLFDRPFSNEFTYAENVTPVRLQQIGGAARHPLQIAYWHQHTLKRYLAREKPDILLSPDGSIPLKASTPAIAAIHDLNFEHFPEDLPYAFRKYYRYYYPRMAAKASRIVTVSEFCKSDIVEQYHIPPEKIDVVYNGTGNFFRPPGNAELNEAKEKFSSGLPYFLFLGSIHARKNIEGMIEAFNLYKTRTHTPAKFIIAGARRWWNKDMQKAFENSPFNKDILLAGRIPEEEIPLLMAGASAFVLVSKFEGFGIPVIEAMKCGVPVICSNTSAFPEIAGDAAMMVNPFSTDEIAQAMEKVRSDSSFRQTLIRKGFQRAENFSWDRSAENLWKSILRCVVNAER